MQSLLDMYAQFLDLSKSNPVVAGMVGLWGAGVVTYLLRNLPKKLWDVFVANVTTSLMLTNAGAGGMERQFISFQQWAVKRPGSTFTRRFALVTDSHNGIPAPVLNSGFGRHFFIYKGRLFWYVKTKLDSSGTFYEKYEIVIRGLTRSKTLLEELVEDFRYRENVGGTSVVEWGGFDWNAPNHIPKRDLSTVVLNAQLKQKLLESIQSYVNNEAWYRARNLPYKLTLVLEGPPGTGKTSLARAVAGFLNRDVFSVNLGTLKDGTINKVVRSVPKGSVLLIEDFDTNAAVAKRKNMTTGNNFGIEHDGSDVYAKCQYGTYRLSEERTHVVSGDSDGNPPDALLKQIFEALLEATALAPAGAPEPDNVLPPSGLSLSALLNALDGVVPLDDVLVFMTTNAIKDIDPALLRKGRVDDIFHIPFLGDEEVIQYIQTMCPQSVIPIARRFLPIAGCDLQALYLDNKWDEQAFIDSIPFEVIPAAELPKLTLLPKRG